MAKIKISDYVFKFLKEKGLKSVFILPGGGAMHLVDSLGRSGLEYVCCLHEQGASIAAEAYAQYTGNLGCALVTTGPGGTNAVTGCASAWVDSIPVIFISGQVKRSDLAAQYGVRQLGFQEINIVDIVKPITKYAVTILEPEKICYYLEKAFFLAKHGRPGPVWLDIPLDVQAAEVELEKLERYIPEISDKLCEDELEKKVLKIVELLNESERPIFLAGNGVRLAGAMEEFYEVIKILGIPVQTTWKSIDFLPDEHPFFAGRPGLVASRWANFAIQSADFLLSVGARLDVGITAYQYENFARRAKKAVVDVDLAEIKKLKFPVEVSVVCDAKVFLKKLLEFKDRIKRKDRRMWFEKIKEWKKKYPVVEAEYYKHYGKVIDYVLIDVLSELLREGDVLVPGSSGGCSERTMQAFRVPKGVRVLNSPGLGAMGFGLPASIGACIASGRKRTICINGDGGFFLNIQELEVVRRLNLPIKFFVLNNGGYASIRATQKRFFGRFVASTPESGMTLPSVRKVAEAFEIKTYLIEKQDKLKEKVKEVLEAEGPIVCEVLCEERETKPRVASKKLPDGRMISLSMEDMYPFLDKEVLEREFSFR